MPLNPFVKKSEAVSKKGKLKKGYMTVTFKNGQTRYKKELPKKKTAKTVPKKQVKIAMDMKKTTKEKEKSEVTV